MGRLVDKVTCIITRRTAVGDELVVFDHPRAGVQLPAGTSLLGEPPAHAAIREGWEETGIPRLRVKAELGALVEATPGCGHGRLVHDAVVGNELFTRGHAATVLESRGEELFVAVVNQRGWIRRDAYTDDVVRHVMQLESDASTPDEWWVVTPDGGGLCWRCRWVPLHGEIGLIHEQADWLAEVAGGVQGSEPGRAFPWPDHPLHNKTTHLQFWAFPGVERRFVVSWVPPHVAVDDSLVRRALVAPRTRDGQVVLVSGDGRRMWNFPGGGREPGEAIEDTARREVAEEACATIRRLQLIGRQHLLHLDDSDRVVDEELQARFAADVDIDPWNPAFEIGARQQLPLDQVRTAVGTWWHAQMLNHIIEGATAVWRTQSEQTA